MHDNLSYELYNMRWGTYESVAEECQLSFERMEEGCVPTATSQCKKQTITLAVWPVNQPELPWVGTGHRIELEGFKTGTSAQSEEVKANQPFLVIIRMTDQG
jgi:hypothetical protein